MLGHHPTTQGCHRIGVGIDPLAVLVDVVTQVQDQVKVGDGHVPIDIEVALGIVGAGADPDTKLFHRTYG